MSKGGEQTSAALDVVALPLHGRHLIEASAGTGKTFNITRLYLRLLLEKKLSVQQILVMTFTNAATEEIRGRIAQTLDAALSYWQGRRQHSTVDDDPVFEQLYMQFAGEEAEQVLQGALLELDEASVYTIHGFCNRILSELAFSGGAAMQLALQTDTRELYLQATRDWIRFMAGQAEEYGLLVNAGWHIPQQFLATFESAIRSSLTPHVVTEQDIKAQAEAALSDQKNTLQPLFEQVRNTLDEQYDVIADALIDNDKNRALRVSQFEQITEWLENASVTPAPAALGKFIHGNRLRGKDELKALLAPLKTLAAEVKSVIDAVEKQRDAQLDAAPAMGVAAQAFIFIRTHVSRQKAQQGIVDFDDLITMLAQKTDHADTELARALRRKFPAALIDEFQDTDANQYQILSSVYPPGSETEILLMIGDPKQAIYGFRGGDIFTYLKAGKSADYRWVMDTNYRSVPAMVQSYNRLFFGAPLSGPPAEVFGFDIHYDPVKAASKASANKTPLSDPQCDREALNYIALDIDPAQDTPAKFVMQQQLAQWIAAEIVRLLQQARLGESPLKPQDIAILVRSASEAKVIQQALQKAGLASVFLSNRENLFAAAEASDLYRVLDGIWHYSDHGRLCAALSSPMFGFSHQTLIDLLYHENDQLWESVMETVSLLRRIWLQRGCMALILHLMEESFTAGGDEIERQLTNYLHLSEVLEREATTRAQPEQLLIWLHRQISEPDSAQEHVQRLESDAHLIQLITQHGAKGLEYPIVFVPFASDYRNPVKIGNQQVTIFRYFDDTSKALRLQLGATPRVRERVTREADAEAMRLLYVAVTRAAHRCYLGVAPFENHRQSSLAMAAGVAGYDSWEQAITRISEEPGTATALITATGQFQSELAGLSAHEKPALQVDTFQGDVKEAWRLYSFSALARKERVVNQTRREAELQEVLVQPTALPETLQTRFAFQKGAAAGNLLHDILEVTDFSEPDWYGASQTAVLGPVTQLFGLDETQSEALFNWLQEVLDTPLNSDGLTLSCLSKTVTLREAEFYFPMANVSQQQLNQFLADYRQEQDHGARFFPAFDTHQLEGMMHGFIDLIFEYEGRYFVADYKSTYLGDTFSDYLPDKLRQNNQHHLYDLQYLIYSVALHRYLQNSLPDYSPQQHFGGVYYLYVRGMHPANKDFEGVYYTSLSVSRLQALDDLFASQVNQDNTGEDVCN
ncbi:exodeoxyribonuclease V subunit beta [Salinimonas sp. HHU 13199]|uniref:RecBCD enzyme subunit RecB n=1 Tax=Salinimonas profundi TaxID=2729140 RepID=A0ABR8LD49_9ALTE|nr:exodeoxyribonuclease V subunit beta [Salinimonas profundi]MBD3584234.1 exodeoxyribonuclease V subunit beta [Salinimonas profundi]